MVAYNFQSQFVDPILSGTKLQTIRQIGKRRHARPGETLQLYTGMRTNRCYRIITDPVCIAAIPVELRIGRSLLITQITLGESILTRPADLEAFARNDGFASLQAMSDYWRASYGEPIFTGLLIAWQPTEPKPKRRRRT